MSEDPEAIAISKFKATCLAVLERVHKTGRPILVTRFGEPIAEVVPPPVRARASSWLGSFRSTGSITGDVAAPASDETDWDSLHS